ncbi:YhdP family protein [Phreatobacter sp. AB_2022a]|uniref:YhdP family protein n=1 Tax=Phreatobacter sp. AB_2022a TaxID=3003134 RepID=UPI002287337F|nr:DUF3971 domain-containing protein [Phreatobacter sp. AB_2022a]MCZ0733921.1 DUF3971 domain-containing protein [Phreatobacter sp. AB_2022a]
MDIGAEHGRPCAPAPTRPGRFAALWENRRVPPFLTCWLQRRWWSWRRGVVAAVAALFLAVAAPCAYLTWQISRGGTVALDLLTPWIASSLSSQLGDGRSVTIGSAVAARDVSGGVEVEAENVTIHDAEGRRIISMPRVALGLDGMPLLGRPSVRRIDLVGASVALKLGEDGQIAFAAGEFRTSPLPPAAAPEAGGDQAPQAEIRSNLAEPDMSPFRRLGIWLDLMEKSGLDGHRLIGVGLRNGTVIVDDVRSGKRFIFGGIDFDMKAPAAGGLTLSVAASGSGARWNSQAAITPRDAEGRRKIDLVVAGLSPRDLSLALQNPELFHADTPISGSLKAELDSSGDPAQFAGRVALGAGTVGDVSNPEMRIAIDQAAADVRWQAGTRGLSIERVHFSAGQNQGEMNGTVWTPAARGEPLVVEIANAATVTSLLNPQEPPVPLGLTQSRFVYQPDSRVLTIERMNVNQGAATVANVTGRATLTSAAPAISLRVEAPRLALADGLRLWPRITNPHVRDWVVDNLSGGVAEDTIVRIEIAEGQLATMPMLLEPDALLVQSKLRGTALRVLPNLTPLKAADIDVLVDGQATRLNVQRGILEPAPGKRLTLSQGSFTIAEHRVADPRSASRFRLEGSAEAAFALLGQDAFKGAATGPALPTGPVRGNVVANVTVNVPISDKLQPSQIDYRVDADFTAFAGDKVFGEMRIENASFKVVTTPRDFLLRGDGRLGGAQANFEYRKPRPDAKPVIRLTATLDDAGRNRLGLNIGSRIVGPTPLKVTTEGDDSGRYAVEADLTQATLAELLPGWNKPRGQAAKARFTAIEGEGGWRLEDLVVEGRGVLVRGSALLDNSGSLVSGLFPAYNLSDGDRINVRVERAGNGHKVTVRGEMMDARQLIRHMQDPTQLGGTSASAGQATELDIDMKTAAIAGGNGEVIRQFEMRLVKRGAEIRNLTASGRVGRNAPFAIGTRGQGSAMRLAVSSGDAGAVLRFLDLWTTMQGGSLALIMTPPRPDGTIRDGNVEITNFTIRGDRAIAGMVAAAGDPRGGRRGPPPQANDAFAFSRLRAAFTRTGSKVEVSDGLLWGAAIGATVEGEVDTAHDQLKLRGTYVPAYALNNLFARIPVLGVFLGGSPDEGVFGITYEIAGAFNQPRLTVNPLSAVAPGFLRKMFEFRGRSVVRSDDPATGGLR